MSTYVCNICGAMNTNGGTGVHRELVPCERCASNARFRAIILGLTYGLTGRLQCLSEIKPDPKIRGFGCSDSEVYASRLRHLFDYKNTFLHADPHVDIADRSTLSKFVNSHFIICSDVIEHTFEPPAVALRNLYEALAPNGILVLSAPTFAFPLSVERYPSLRSYQTVTFGERYVIVYETKLGSLGFDAEPRFHGGPGQILEMRVISHAQLLQELREVGFQSVETLGDSFGKFGATWPPMVERADVPFTLDGRVILARKLAYK
jgi:SAM-dependent methyltransferase